MFESSNPALSETVFDRAEISAGEKRMTVSGAVNASLVLGGICAACAVGAWTYLSANPSLAFPVLLGGGLLGLVLGLVLAFKPSFSYVLAPAYAVVQGGFVGAVSLVYAQATQGGKYAALTGSGIVLQAAVLTFAILFAMLFLYKMRILQATKGFVRGVMVATVGAVLFSLTTFGLQLFGVQMPWLFSGWIAIAISATIVVIASMNLIVDFGRIESNAEAGSPKYMEWYCAFGLLVTVVWLYLTLLRLLSIINRRD